MSIKTKLKFTTKNIFKIIFLILVLLNLFVLFFLVKFIKSQVYDTMFMTREELLKQSNLTVEDIDIDAFNSVIEKINNKKKIDDTANKNNTIQD